MSGYSLRNCLHTESARLSNSPCVPTVNERQPLSISAFIASISHCGRFLANICLCPIKAVFISWNSVNIIIKIRQNVNIVELHERKIIKFHIIKSWNSDMEFHDRDI